MCIKYKAEQIFPTYLLAYLKFALADVIATPLLLFFILLLYESSRTREISLALLDRLGLKQIQQQCVMAIALTSCVLR